MKKSDSADSLDTIRYKKICLANINKTKQNNKLSKSTQTNPKIFESKLHQTQNPENIGNNNNKYLSFKNFSLLNKFILQMMDPDEMIEDYVQEENKPFDRYTKFKKTCAREKIRINKLLNNVSNLHLINKEKLKEYFIQYKKHHM